MRAIDANVLLRYVLKDVPDQAEASRRLIDSDEVLGVAAVALAEAAWTLRGPTYQRPRRQVVEALLGVLARENVVALGFDKTEAEAALRACGRPQRAANFGDALIAATARSAGITEIYSFDRRFERAGLATISPRAR